MIFNFKLDDEALMDGIEILKNYYDFSIDTCGKTLQAQKCEKGFSIQANGNDIILKYSDKHLFFTGFSYCMQNYKKQQYSLKRISCVERLGLMRDCARNAIVNFDGFKDLVVYLSLMGYNYIELYIEDLLEIPSLPYLGHARGRYGKDEIQKFDEFAKIFGIELVPCIQTLAHLPHIFRHDAFAPINDIFDILLIGDEKTYDFIEKVIAFVAESFTSKRINIGMDEAHMMGMGAYLLKNGYKEKRGEMFLKHLSRVLDICRKYNFKPSMWSDMFFKVGLDIHIRQSYVGMEGKEFSEEFKRNIPADVTLIFWDYYHTDINFYNSVFEKHFELTDNVSFAGGAWTWQGFSPFNGYAERSLGVAIESCRKNNKCKDFMVTAWGDGGGECSYFAPVSTYLFTAEKLFSEDCGEKELNARAKFLFGNTYEELKNTEVVNRTSEESYKKWVETGKLSNPAKYVLYNDVLLGVLDAHIYEDINAYFLKNSEQLKKFGRKGKFGYVFESLYRLSRCAEVKATLGIDLTKAYKSGNKNELLKIADERIPLCIKRVNEFYKAYKIQWMKENKSFGFEVTDIRIGSVLFRLEQNRRTIKSYLNGEIDRIEELEITRLPICTFMQPKEDICYNMFTWSASGSIV